MLDIYNTKKEYTKGIQPNKCVDILHAYIYIIWESISLSEPKFLLMMLKGNIVWVWMMGETDGCADTTRERTLLGRRHKYDCHNRPMLLNNGGYNDVKWTLIEGSIIARTTAGLIRVICNSVFPYSSNKFTYKLRPIKVWLRSHKSQLRIYQVWLRSSYKVWLK